MPDQNMPDQEVALGKAAEEKKSVAGNDMLNADGTLNTDRYYYRPGTTEPELRPEFANEAAAPSEEEDLDSLKKAELVELAEEKGIDVKSNMTKADIIELIESEE